MALMLGISPAEARVGEAPFHSAQTWLSLLLLLATGLIQVGAQQSANSEFSIQVWQTEDGLPQNSVTSILQSRKGYLWFGTFNGLVRFDGVAFKVFNSGNTPGLRNSRVTSLFEDAAERIWIGHETGELTCYDQGVFRAINLTQAGGSVVSISADGRDDLWLVGERGLLLRQRDGMAFPKDPGTSFTAGGIPSLARDDSGRLWMVRNGDASLVESNGLKTEHFGSADPEPFFSKICASHDGGLWVVGEGRLRKWRAGGWVADLGSCPWGNTFVTSMMETTSGRLLVGTIDKGLFVFDVSAGTYSRLARPNSLPQDWVRCLTEDEEGNIWAGTSAGLVVLRPRRVKMLSPPDNYQGKPLLGITRGSDGAIWAGTEGAGLYCFREGAWTSFGPEQGLQNLYVWSVLVDSKQRVWAGTWRGGLFLLDGDRFGIPPAVASLREPVAALAESPQGDLWIGTGVGLMRFSNEQLEDYSRLGGPAAGDIRAIWCAADGTVYIGTSGQGLGRLRGQELARFSKQDGLASQFILSLYMDGDGVLWIGTLDAGICRFKDGRFATIGKAHGLPNEIIGQIAEDHTGNLWTGSQAGLIRVGRLDLDRCADRRASSVNAVVYGKEEGLTTLACSAGFQPNVFKTPEGWMWFPTAKGLAGVHYTEAPRNSLPPPVLLEDVLVEGNLADLKPTARGASFASSRLRSDVPYLEMQPGQSRLEIHFSAINFTAPERARFRWMLDGLETGWTEGGNRRMATYAYLPPGSYVFHVLACNSDGLWNGAGASLAIQVLPHFWQTWVFKLSTGFLTLACVSGLVFLDSRRRHHRKLERLAQERALEAERSRIARDIHDDLGASLTRISILSQAAVEDLREPQRAAKSLREIDGTARELTRTMDEIVWAVNPHHDTLESLANYLARLAQDFLATAQIRCRLDVPLRLPAWPVRSEIRHNVFLAFKEVLNNVVKHAHASEVHVSLQISPSGFSLEISDNGCGFDLKPQPTGRANVFRAASGNGLANLKSRLERIGGRCEITSSVGGGTRVKFFIHRPSQHSGGPGAARLPSGQEEANDKAASRF